MAQQSVGDGGRLLGDLLEHEVLVATLFGGRGVPVDVKDAVVGRRINRIALKVGDAVAVRGNHNGLVLAELDSLAGVLDERSDIGADEHLTVTDAEHQRGGTPSGHDRARFVSMGEDQREVTLEPAQHRAHRRREVSRIVAKSVFTRDEMDGDFGVGIAGEFHSGALELITQCGEVLDDAVVNHRDFSGGVHVRMGVAVGGPTVGSPPGVPDPGGADEAVGLAVGEGGLEIGQASCLAAHGQPTPTVDQRYAG